MKVTFSVFFSFFLQGYKGFETKRKLPFYFWNYRSACASSMRLFGKF